MKPEIKIALYGGTKLSGRNIKLVQHLARAFLKDPQVVLVSGGIEDPQQENVSVDFAAFQAAVLFTRETGQDLEKRFQTWLSETPRPGIKRETWGKPLTLKGSPNARRFQLVRGVDALVTIEGEGKTTTILELAMALERVALPIGFTGTDSSHFWKTDRSYYVQTVGLDTALAERMDHPPGSDDEMMDLAEQIAIAVLKKAGRRCMVLMDYTDNGHGQFFKNVVTKAVNDAGFSVHKLNEQESAGDILKLFLTNLHSCHAIIIDLTGPNQNVLYELGRVHQYGGIQPLIIVRNQDQKLPYYVARNLVSMVGNNEKEAYKVIIRYLTENRRRL